MMKIPPCGSYCKNCLYFKRKECSGCVETNGKPFYIDQTEKDICPVWECAIGRKVKHCGECDDFPCDMYLDWYCPKMGRTGTLRCAGLLTLRRKIGDKEWIKWIKDKKIKFGT